MKTLITFFLLTLFCSCYNVEKDPVKLLLDKLGNPILDFFSVYNSNKIFNTLDEAKQKINDEQTQIVLFNFYDLNDEKYYSFCVYSNSLGSFKLESQTT